MGIDLTADCLLQFQRCGRRAFLDRYGNPSHKDPPADYLKKLLRDSTKHRRQVLANLDHDRPVSALYKSGDWLAGAAATDELMRQGVACIQQGVVLTHESDTITLISTPDLLVKQPGISIFGDWCYAPIAIKLGKRPKLEYQVGVVFDTYVLAAVQGTWPEQTWLILREKGLYSVDLWQLLPQMQATLADCIHMLSAVIEPEVFIARNRCGLCPWFTHCYAVAQAQAHLSLVAGITPSRYAALKAANVTTIEALAATSVTTLASLPGFGKEAAEKLLLQAQASLEQRALPRLSSYANLAADLPTHPIELYFDIEADPDSNLDYLLGVLVVNRKTQAETFYPFLAETAQEEGRIWQQFLDLLANYPDAPIFHFCPYETHTIQRLATLYATPATIVTPIVNRCVDLHELATRTTIFPVESYALKHIARWLGFQWRDANANGAQAVCWYAQWLETGDRTYLDTVVQYNEDDCRAMYHLKDWLVAFLQPIQYPQAG